MLYIYPHLSSKLYGHAHTLIYMHISYIVVGVNSTQHLSASVETA